MKDKPMSEADIIAGCKQGDRKAQELLYKMYASKMYAVCLRYSKDRMEAEDFLQEGFVKVFQNIHRYQPNGPFGGWIRRVFVNAAIEIYRKNARSPISQPDEMPDGVDDQETPIEHLGVKELIQMITAMPDGYRQVFNLFAIEGYMHQEIAAMLGISEGTSKSQYARARKYLQEVIRKTQEKNHATSGKI